jgi:dTDP-4-dehydrorhamnose 3,5-epimerase-like enzyme
VSLPGVVRGNHYHTKGRETITVLGPSLVRFREEGKIEEILVPDREARRFLFLPGISHAIKNLSEEANLLVAFNTVEHDPADPDTHRDLLISP